MKMNKILLFFLVSLMFGGTTDIAARVASPHPTIRFPELNLQYDENVTGEVGNPSLGFRFMPPEGWVTQTSSDGVLLGHNTIAGLILVMPHQAQSQEQMQQEMAEGLQDEGTYLMLSGNINTTENKNLIADYEGYIDGTRVKGIGIGVLSPNGGGAYIIAVTTPEMLGNELTDAAKTIARNMHFVKMEASDLMSFFAGKWSTFTTNTSTDIYLYPNGVYSEHYESSYSGSFQDGGVDAGNWGAGNQSNDSGKWMVQGTRETGTITIITPDGEQQTVEYHVHVENGETYYNEYWFNGSLYSKTALGY